MCGCQLASDPCVWMQPTIPTASVGSAVSARTAAVTVRAATRARSPREELGMKYVYLPMRGTAEYPYAPEALKSFATARSEANGKVLLHCTIAWRASHLWAAYLIQYRHLPVETALRQTPVSYTHLTLQTN